MLSITVDGQDVTLDQRKDRVVIGRSKANDIVIDQPTIADPHLVIERRDDGWYVTDHGEPGTTAHQGQTFEELAIAGRTELVLGGDDGVTVIIEDTDAEQATDTETTRAEAESSTGTSEGRSRKGPLVGLLLLGLIGAGLVVFALTRGDSDPEPNASATTTQADTPETSDGTVDPADAVDFAIVRGTITVAAPCDDLGEYDDVPALKISVLDIEESRLITMDRAGRRINTDDGNCLILFEGENLPRQGRYLIDAGRLGETNVDAASFGTYEGQPLIFALNLG